MKNLAVLATITLFAVIAANGQDDVKDVIIPREKTETKKAEPPDTRNVDPATTGRRIIYPAPSSSVDVTQLTMEKSLDSGSLKVNADYITKKFNLKLTKIKRVAGSIILTFEFAKNADDLGKVIEAFTPVPDSKEEKREPVLYVYGFDVDNVPILQRTISGTEGTIMGIAGDAFRVILKDFGGDKDGNIRKIEFRPPTVIKPSFGGHALPIPSSGFYPAGGFNNFPPPTNGSPRIQPIPQSFNPRQPISDQPGLPTTPPVPKE